MGTSAAIALAARLWEKKIRDQRREKSKNYNGAGNKGWARRYEIKSSVCRVVFRPRVVAPSGATVEFPVPRSPPRRWVTIEICKIAYPPGEATSTFETRICVLYPSRNIQQYRLRVQTTSTKPWPARRRFIKTRVRVPIRILYFTIFVV